MIKDKTAIENKKRQLLDMTEKFCDKYLDEDYKNLSNRLISKMSRKRTLPFMTGKIEIWSAAVIYALGSINFLFDKSFKPYASADDICDYFGTNKNTTSQKAKIIRDMFNMNYFDREFSTAHMKENDPFSKLRDDKWFYRNGRLKTMKKIIVDAYKLKRVSSLMAKEFGSIPKGEEGEEPYSLVLFHMEHNLLKLHRQNPLRSGQKAMEAIQMSLLTIDGYFREIDYDFSRFINEENQSFMHGLLMVFDPFINSEINKIVNKDSNCFVAKEYFKLPVMCLLRIEKSIQTWTESFGKNGYFEFIEGQIGSQVKSDDELDFIIELKGKLVKKHFRSS